MKFKLVLLLCCICLIGSIWVNSAHAPVSLQEKQVSIVNAIKSEENLIGLTKKQIRDKFGYAVYRKKDKEKEGNIETWIYRPFDYGTYKITLTFKDDKVISVSYND